MAQATDREDPRSRWLRAYRCLQTEERSGQDRSHCFAGLYSLPDVATSTPDQIIRARDVIDRECKGCFDNLSHHHLLNRQCQRVVDGKMSRLIGRFLKPWSWRRIFLRTDNGTRSKQSGNCAQTRHNTLCRRSVDELPRHEYATLATLAAMIDFLKLPVGSLVGLFKPDTLVRWHHGGFRLCRPGSRALFTHPAQITPVHSAGTLICAPTMAFRHDSRCDSLSM